MAEGTTIEVAMRVLREASVRHATEAGLHLGLMRALASAGLSASRETRLSGRDRVDISVPLVSGRLLVAEIKIAGGLAEIERQVARYLAHDEVEAVVLVSTRMQHGAIAREIDGKRVLFLHKSVAFL